MTAVDIAKDVIRSPGQTGRLTVGTSVVRITTVPVELFTGVNIRASGNNTGIIYIGFLDSLTTSNGFPLNANDGISVPVPTLNLIYLISDTVSQNIFWLAM